MFQNYSSFEFMFENLAQDITVVTTRQVQDDDLGTTTYEDTSKVHLREPILNTQNPNVTYSNTDGGQYPTTVYYWESKHPEFNKGDKVITTDNQFKVTAKATDVAGKLWFYTLKRVGDDE